MIPEEFGPLRQKGSAGFLMLFVLALLVVMAIGFVLGIAWSEADPPAKLAQLGLVAPALTVLIWWYVMILRSGVYLRREGLLIRRVRSRLVAWHEISRLELRRAGLRVGGADIPVPGRCLLVHHRDGTAIRTPLVDTSVFFLGRPHEFRRLIDVIKSEAARHGVRLS